MYSSLRSMFRPKSRAQMIKSRGEHTCFFIVMRLIVAFQKGRVAGVLRGHCDRLTYILRQNLVLLPCKPLLNSLPEF